MLTSEAGSNEVSVEPSDLIEKLGEFGGTRLGVHASVFTVPGVAQIHAPLAVREARLCGIGRCNVDIVAANHKVDNLALLGSFGSKGVAPPLVFEVGKNHVRLEDGHAIGADKGRNLLERINPRKLLGAEIRVAQNSTFHEVGNFGVAPRSHMVSRDV